MVLGDAGACCAGAVDSVGGCCDSRGSVAQLTTIKTTPATRATNGFIYGSSIAETYAATGICTVPSEATSSVTGSGARAYAGASAAKLGNF